MSVNKYNSTTGNLETLDGYTVDSTPTQNSGNPVSSGGVFTALAGKLDKTGGTASGDITANNFMFNGGGVQHFGTNIPYIDIKFSRDSWVIGLLIGNINGFGNAFVIIRHDGTEFKFYNNEGVDISSSYTYSWTNNALRLYPPDNLTWYSAIAITL